MKWGRETAVLWDQEYVTVPLTCSESSTDGSLAGRRAWTRAPHCLKQTASSTEGANQSMGLLGLPSGVTGAAELVPPVPGLWQGCRNHIGQFALSTSLTTREGVGAT